MRPIKLIAPAGSIVNALPPAAVAGGNVETSQRIVDVLFRALRQGRARSHPGRELRLDVESDDRRLRYFSRRGISPTTKRSRAAPAPRPRHPGASGIHTHMTNTLNTPIEALEAYYPMRITEYRMRRGSGGAGKFDGGDGLVRELECLVESNVSLLTERRMIAPWGLAGGGDGASGANYLITKSGKRRKLASKTNLRLSPGDRLRLETPGGGSFGKKR